MLDTRFHLFTSFTFIAMEMCCLHIYGCRDHMKKKMKKRER